MISIFTNAQIHESFVVLFVLSVQLLFFSPKLINFEQQINTRYFNSESFDFLGLMMQPITTPAATKQVAGLFNLDNKIFYEIRR